MTASADHLKALLSAHAEGDDDRFYSIALQVVAKSARQGHTRLATELRELIDSSRAQKITRRPTPTPVVQPRGELASLLTADYPDIRLSDMTLADEPRALLEKVLHEQRQRSKLERFGFTPVHRLLLSGPPGTGKSMTAAALAKELGLPLFTIRLDGLISRFMGETASKLRLVFDAAAETRAVYLFDEFDALGADRAASNDVGEARRILNSFLLFLDQAPAESLVVAATNHRHLLDGALFRRFDLAILYAPPSPDQAIEVLRRRLAAMDTSAVAWPDLAALTERLSHAELVKASESAAKRAILGGSDVINARHLREALEERHSLRHA
ncbi:ATP-binding protein [Streptomyces sp. A0592]|uniref:AAA family ATPase n=1 Tax=Streptomyces sp. A0592 TaxID=2563099 RepID=UPI00109ED2FF|nr:ATP-binding protein [Streptomyces sp. A0592]THA83148.1 ATP-binding protein [Streptomyces sp. A0592]